jgi:membrane protein DedA with SNARE-associated domain
VGNLVEQFIEALLGFRASTIYLLIGVLCWAESAFFLGFVTPGEIAVATGGILASAGQVTLGWLIPVVVVGTLAGNSTGYWLGRRWGTGVLEWKPLQKPFGGAIGIARDFMERQGEWAIVLGRLATPTRIVVPFLCGAYRLSYRRFILFDVPATLVWAVAWSLLGFFLGQSWSLLQEVAGTAAIFVLVLFILGLLIRWITVLVARNQRRVQALFRLFLKATGTRGLARTVAPAFFWFGRRLDPRLAQGLTLTLGFLVLVAAVGGVGLVLSQTQAVRGLALLDFPVLEWMVANRTAEAVALARGGLWIFRWPEVLLLTFPIAAVAAWTRSMAGLRLILGLVGAGAGAHLLDVHVLEGIVPRAEFPSIPVAVATTLFTQITLLVARKWGWGPSVMTAGVGFFLLCTIALGTVVAGWAAPSGIILGFALGLGWAVALELLGTIGSGARPPPTEPQRPLPQPNVR